MEIGMFFLSLILKNAKKLGKLAKFFLVVCEPRQNLGKMTKKVIRYSEFFPKNVEILWVVREPRQNLSSGPRVGKG